MYYMLVSSCGLEVNHSSFVTGRMFSVRLFWRAEDCSCLVVVLANGSLVLLPLSLPLLHGILVRSLLVLVLLPVVRLSLGFVLAVLAVLLRGSVVLGAADCLQGKVSFTQAERPFIRGLHRVSWKEL